MAMSGGIYRRALCFISLFCSLLFLSSAYGASGTSYPVMPTAQAVAATGTPVSSTANSLVLSKPLTGQFIPGVDGSKTPVRGVLGGIDFSIPRTINAVKSGLRGGVAGMVATAAVGAMVNAVGGFIDENTKMPMKNGKKLTPASDLYWCRQPSDSFCDNSTPTKTKLSTPTEYPILFEIEAPNNDLCSSTYNLQNNGAQVLITYSFHQNGRCNEGAAGTSQVTYYRRGSCPAPSHYDSGFMQCVEEQPVPFEDTDYDQMGIFASGQNAAWLQGLLNAACTGSIAPTRCFEELKQGSILSGPSQVQGPSKTSTTTSTSPSGVTTQTTTTKNTNFNITYGSNYYKYAPVTTTTITNPDGSTQNQIDTEPMPADPEPTEDEPPPEEQITPSLCAGTSCDGPAYVDQYEPTSETKEDHIDSYIDRVSGIPIIQAVGGLFDISVGGSCPVWTFDHQMSVLGATMPINLVFDFLCQSWFTSYGPWIRAVIYAVCVAIAIRIALL